MFALASDMPHISAVYTASRDPLSALARLVTGNAKWSHCGVLIGTPTGDVVVEARMWYGVVATPFNEWVARCPHYEVVEIDCPDPAAGEAFALAQVGKKYDYLGALGVPFRSHWQDPTRWYCSEKLESVLLAAGRNRWRDTKQAISPQESFDVL